MVTKCQFSCELSEYQITDNSLAASALSVHSLRQLHDDYSYDMTVRYELLVVIGAKIDKKLTRNETKREEKF